MATVLRAPTTPGGIKAYYQAKVEAAELTINQKTQNLRRLEAQRNALNARGNVVFCSKPCVP
jgi:26S proteasome regulatory subunit T6